MSNFVVNKAETNIAAEGIKHMPAPAGCDSAPHTNLSIGHS
jgi:hypothetical protein